MRRPAALSCLLLVLAFVLPSWAHAQTFSVKGRFVDPNTNAPVAQVAVKMTSFADSADVKRTNSKEDGSFEVTGLGAHSYRLEATRVGHAPLKQVIRVTQAGQNLGVLQMVSEAVNIAGITITESPAPAIQKADTTEFRASAVKTNRDATAEELVQKMPGVTVENGQVKTNGENVQQVLVNGRPFFGSDPTAAMRNLPAEVVDRIQVYDRSSDQAEFSGFEDGQQQKTMNFILRDQKARFGKVYGGFGPDDKYQGGGNATWMRGANRVTLIGLSNNINQRNFSPMDLFGAMSGGGNNPMMRMMSGFRPPGGGGGGGGGGGMRWMMGGGGFGGGGFDPGAFFVNQQGGITTTHSGGLNYAGQWGPKLAVTSSVFVNDADNTNDQSVQRTYLPAQDSLASYAQTLTTANRNRNQRFDARFEWTVDSLNSIILQPRLYFQQSRATNHTFSENLTPSGATLNSSDLDSRNHTTGNNLSNTLTIRHRFAKKGRNVSVEVRNGHSERDGDRDQAAINVFHRLTGDTTVVTDQQTASGSTTNSVSTRIAFTEPITKGWMAQAIYNPQYTRSRSNADTRTLDGLGAYTVIDSAQSNRFVNTNIVQNGGLAVLHTFGTWRWLTQASVQQSRLESEQSFPRTNTFDKTFTDVLPSMTLSGTIGGKRNVRLNWNTAATAPSISQLQNVVDNSNPLSLSSGNPDLRQTYTNTFSLRVSEAEPFKMKSRFMFVNVSRTAHPIANDTRTLPGGVQFTQPVNLDEAAWNASLFGVYSRPAKFLKSIVSVNSGLTYNLTPSSLNGRTNLGRTYAVRGGGVLSSNISQNLDFTLSYQGSWNMTRNSLSNSTTGDYYAHTIGLRLNAVTKYGIVLREEASHNLQSGVASGFGQDVVLWNTSLGKKFLKNQNGEFRLTLTDALQQEKSVQRNVTDTYVQDSRDQVLGRYWQAIVTLNFK